MKLRDVHVGIVGAGPAGSAAAVFLRRHGAQVTLLERGHFPRDKVCGDGCTPRTLWMLRRLSIEHLPKNSAALLDKVMFVAPGGEELVADLPEHIFGGRAAVVPRAVLDRMLVELAVDAGAVLREGVYVSGIERDADGVTLRCRNGNDVRADVVLGCDGSPSIVRRELGAPPFPKEHGAFAVRAYYEGLHLTHPDAFGLYWDRELLPAYGWIFPLPDGRANVGLGLRADYLARSPRKLPELLDEFCRNPRVAAELSGGRRVGRVKGHHLPAGSFANHLVADRALLLGDAAGFINPLTGEGIEFALESGELAADAIADAVSTGGAWHTARGLRGYETRCEDRFRATFRLNRRLQRIFEHPRLVDRLIRAANRSQRVVDELADTMLGERPRMSLRLAAAVALGV
jgi:geranylgeranyl reductase family protein